MVNEKVNLSEQVSITLVKEDSDTEVVYENLQAPIDNLSLSGEVEIILTKPNGTVMIRKANLIVQAGKNLLAQAIRIVITPWSAMALGTGATGPVIGDTTLQTELVRQAFTTSSTLTNVTSMSTTFGAGVGTGAITEAGIFNNNVAGGTMMSRVTFAVVNKAAADTLTLNWTITVN